MKFIKTTDGGYINSSQVEVFYLEKCSGLYAQVKARTINGDIYTLKDYALNSKSVTKFAWLDNFVAKLNEDS